MTTIVPSIFPGGVVSAFSTRRGGVSPAPLGMNLSFRVGDDPENVKKNRELFFESLGVPLDRLAIPAQVHGSTVRIAEKPGDYPEADALLTDRPGVFLCVSMADCVPVLMFDPGRNVVGVVHAGWRGSSAGITGTAVRTMVETFGTDPADLLVSVGPSASSCCYMVGPDVAARFAPEFREKREGGVYVDLKEANRGQLLRSGVRSGNIEVSPHCTISEPELFHSHRRDGAKSGRMMGVIGRIG